MVIQRTPLHCLGNVTNYIELYNTGYGARMGCSKNRRNCCKKVTYGRIPRDTMHMKAIHRGGYHQKPCIARCLIKLTKNDDDDADVDDKEDRNDGDL